VNVLVMDTFSALDWKIDETGLFADNVRTGERILIERFVETARDGMRYANKYAFNLINTR
jgi:hypothetical protein